MESSLDHHDELRRLQDQVRKLQMQNEQLRSQQLTRNGFEFDIKPNILSNLDYYKNKLDHTSYNWDNDFMKPEELHWENIDNEESWLYVPKNCKNSPKNIRKWLQQDINSQCDYELQNVRRRLVDKVAEIDQGSPRNFINTGTFTRPKKRIMRPGLEVVGEIPIFESRQVVDSPFKRLMAKQLSDLIDDTSMNYEYSLPSLSSPDLNVTVLETPKGRNFECDLNVTFHRDNANLNTTFCKVSPEGKSVIGEHSHLNSTFIKCNNEMNSEHNSTKSDQTSYSRKTKDSSLNSTCVLGRNNAIQSQTITRVKSPNLNCTFTNADNLRCQTGIADNVADDDQLSSASDSSFSSNTRLMNVGDVQTIARLQEEDLKLMTSTPKRDSGDGILFHSDDPMSPIKRNARDIHQGYLSDHSDHSSVDGRGKSSVRSSPSCSPYGSTNALTNDFHRPPSGVQRRELTVSPVLMKQDVFKSEPSKKITATGQRRVTSGLRPPAVRSSIARPSTAGSSNIPRPASRIPAPRVRSAYTSQQPTHKPDWMDGCY